MSENNGIKANEKPTSSELSYVYAENNAKEFVRVSKDFLKIILGVATKLSELENDAGFVDKLVSDLENYYKKSETYTKEEIDDKLSLVPRFSVQVVSSGILPTEDISETTVYLIPSSEEDENLYTEFIYVNGLWEILGTQKVPKIEVTKESIESALGYTPANQKDVDDIHETVKDLSVVEVSETEPTNENTDIWINPDNEEEYHFYTAEEIDKMLRELSVNGGNAKDGREVELQNNGTYIQWRYVGESLWNNLVALADLKGAKGDTPQKGTDYFTEADKQELVTNVLNALPTWTGGAY